MSSLDSRPLMSPGRPTTPTSQGELDRSVSPVGRRINQSHCSRRRNKSLKLLSSHAAAFVTGSLALALAVALLPAPPPAPSSVVPSSSLLSRALDGLCEIPRRRLLEARSGPGYFEAIDDAAEALPPALHATLPMPPPPLPPPSSFFCDGKGVGGVADEGEGEEEEEEEEEEAPSSDEAKLRSRPPPFVGRGRLVFVGDVHGCADDLERLLFDEVRFDAASSGGEGNGDTLVLLGDVVSKGPDSPRALRIARELGAWAVRGNHDDAALAAYDFYRRSRSKSRSRSENRNKGGGGGGGALPRVSRSDTGGESFEFVRNLSSADARFLREMPWTLEVPSRGVVAVHAGLVPGVAVRRQRPSDVFLMRGVVEIDGGDGGGSGGGGGGGGAESGGSGGGGGRSWWRRFWRWIWPTTTNGDRDDGSHRRHHRHRRHGGGDGGRRGATSASDDLDIDVDVADNDGVVVEPLASKSKSKTKKVKRYRATALPGEGQPWARVWSSDASLNGGKHAVFGHDARAGLQREEMATGIDTGCVYGGELTALVLPPMSAANSGRSRWSEKGVELVSVKCRCGVEK